MEVCDISHEIKLIKISRLLGRSGLAIDVELKEDVFGTFGSGDSNPQVPPNRCYQLPHRNLFLCLSLGLRLILFLCLIRAGLTQVQKERLLPAANHEGRQNLDYFEKKLDNYNNCLNKNNFSFGHYFTAIFGMKKNRIKLFKL